MWRAFPLRAAERRGLRAGGSAHLPHQRPTLAAFVQRYGMRRIRPTARWSRMCTVAAMLDELGRVPWTEVEARLGRVDGFLPLHRNVRHELGCPPTDPSIEESAGVHEVPAVVRARLASWCERVVTADWFNTVSFGLIIINAVVLGAETYDRALDRAGTALLAVEYVCVALFLVELALRFGAHLTAPRAFFRDGWNLFDLLIVCAPLLPGVRENVTLLRLLRLARVVRAVRLFPGLRVVISGVLRSLPGLASFLLIATLTVYLYAMVGWMAFGDAYPDRYGTVGRAMLTLFLLLSLDGITDAFNAGRTVSEWSILYYASYIVMASYLLTNLLIGIVLKALDDAHQAESPRLPAPEPVGTRPAVGAAPAGRTMPASARSPDVDARLRELRTALDALENELAHRAPASGPTSRRESTGRRSKSRRTSANPRI